MSKFKVREKVVVNFDGHYYEGVIWNQNDFREPAMEYAIMLDEKWVGEEGLVFVGEDKISYFPFDFDMEKLVKNAVEPKRNSDGIIIMSREEDI